MQWVDPLGLCKEHQDVAKDISGRGYHIETVSPKAMKPQDVTTKWVDFLGPRPHSNIHPRTGVVDPDRIVSADGKRSIRYGKHEMGSPTNLHHYHEEMWTSDPMKNVMNVDNTIIRISK